MEKIDSMLGSGTQTLQWLALLAVCDGLTKGQVTSQYFLVQKPMSWLGAREHCRTHYVDLAVLSTEEQYLALANATAEERTSFWVGLKRQSISGGWSWVDEEELSYERWYRRNSVGRCASLEAARDTSEKLLARYCDEALPFICQGPVGPQSVSVDSVGSDHVTISWTVSAFMQATPHRYRVTTCTDTCDTLFYPFVPGSASINVSIYNTSFHTKYFITVAAFVLRPDNDTGRNIILQSSPAALQVLTANCCGFYKVRMTILRLLKYMSVAALLWVVYLVLKRDPYVAPGHEMAQAALPTENPLTEQIPLRNKESKAITISLHP